MTGVQTCALPISLHIAAFYGNSRTSAFLISKGADVNAQDRIGMTPLHVAVISGGIREVEALLEEKADINLRTAANQTVLHLSAATGQPKLTRLLLDRGADPNSEDGKGKNPLFYAVQNKKGPRACGFSGHGACQPTGRGDGCVCGGQLFGQEFSISVSTSWEDFSNEIQSVMPTQKLPVPTEPGI